MSQNIAGEISPPQQPRRMPLRGGKRSILGLLAVVVMTMLVSGAQGQATPGDAVRASVAASDMPADVVKADAAEAAALHSSPPTSRIRFHFKKNHQDPTKSELILERVILRNDQPPRYVKLGQWRAGSGIGPQPDGRDACKSNKGWLPNGRYNAHKDGPAYDTNFGGPSSLIFGTVWHVQDKKCHSRPHVKRTELFIHSEMTPDRKQKCGAQRYQENQCWDGDTDYLSEGCIKLSYKDIREAAKLARASGGPKADQKHYRDLLIVTG